MKMASPEGLPRISDKAWLDDINLKLMAAVRICRLVIPHMKEKKIVTLLKAILMTGFFGPVEKKDSFQAALLILIF